MEHTQGKLNCGAPMVQCGRAHVFIYADADHHITTVAAPVDEAIANANRLTACWNACDGIEDPEQLRKQRDELLEACKEGMSYIKVMLELQHKTIDTMKTVMPKSFVPPRWTKPDTSAIKQAIANCKTK